MEHVHSNLSCDFRIIEGKMVASDTEPSAWNGVEGSGRVVIRHRYWALDVLDWLDR